MGRLWRDCGEVVGGWGVVGRLWGGCGKVVQEL